MPETDRADLKGSVIRGVGWMMVAQVATQLLGFATSVVVARFLGPRQVGLAAEALVFGSLALVIVDGGLGAVLIQRPTLTEEDKSTAFWAGIGLGVIALAIGVGLSWPIASLYGEPRVQPLFAVLSLAFLFTAPGIVQGALLNREFKFRSLQVRTIVATAASCAAGMALAVAGLGPWAVIAQDLVITSLSTVLLWRASPWRPTAAFSWATLRGMAGYSTDVFGSKSLDWGTTNLDNFLVGRFVGTAPLGAYAIAYSLIEQPLKRLAHPLTQIFFPAFSRMQGAERIRSAWLGGTTMLAAVVMPAMLGVIVVAPDFVLTIYGAKWHAAVRVIQILAPVGLIQCLTSLNIGILQAVARTRALFRFSLVLAVATVAGFAAGLPWGINGVAVGSLIVTLVFQPVFVWLSTRAVGLTVLDWLRSMSGVVQASLAMLAVVLIGRELLISAHVGAAARLVVLIVAGAAVYIPAVAWRAATVRTEVQGLVRRVAPAGVPAAVRAMARRYRGRDAAGDQASSLGR